MGSAGDPWLEDAGERLSAEGFRLTRGASLEGQTLALVAHRSRFELSKFGNSETFFVFAGIDRPSRESLKQFSAKAFRHAKASKRLPLPCGLFESVYCFAVALVDALDTATAEAVRTETPTRHWAAAEIPVVVERGSGTLHYFEKTPLWGAAYYAGFRTQIKRYLQA